jgi:hypothetical protein
MAFSRGRSAWHSGIAAMTTFGAAPSGTSQCGRKLRQAHRSSKFSLDVAEKTQACPGTPRYQAGDSSAKIARRFTLRNRSATTTPG